LSSLKLTPLIKEEVLDKQIKDSVNEMGELSREIELLKDKLKPLQQKFGDLVDIVLPVVEEMGSENLKTKRYVFRIIRSGYEKRSFSYKEGFLNSLDKVNSNTKRILNEILEQTKKMVKVKPSFQIQPVEGISDWLKKLKMKVKRLIPSLKQIKFGNKELKKLI
jgi:uncharacterized coiled-coil protein SlyX